MGKTLEYRGFTISQASNHHVMISKNDKMLFHAACETNKTEQELREIGDFYINEQSNADVYLENNQSLHNHK